ncbi:hypothetical protein, partial [Streptomyces anulatus]|uniref:hypothetical protein n=1 Tax=Streptomyces anulatus TaxID=1892 RepID=UPI003F4DBC6A
MRPVIGKTSGDHLGKRKTDTGEEKWEIAGTNSRRECFPPEPRCRTAAHRARPDGGRSPERPVRPGTRCAETGKARCGKGEKVSGRAATDGAGDASEIDMASPREILPLHHVNKSSRGVTRSREGFPDRLKGFFSVVYRRRYSASDSVP